MRREEGRGRLSAWGDPLSPLHTGESQLGTGRVVEQTVASLWRGRRWLRAWRQGALADN